MFPSPHKTIVAVIRKGAEPGDHSELTKVQKMLHADKK